MVKFQICVGRKIWLDDDDDDDDDKDDNNVEGLAFCMPTAAAMSIQINRLYAVSNSIEIHEAGRWSGEVVNL